MSQDDEVYAVMTAAIAGDVSAQNNLGHRYENGEGVQQDLSIAHEWHTKAAMQGDSDSQFQLGRLYYFGIGVCQNSTTAFRWYEKSANQGLSIAQNNLAMMYFSGEVVEQSFDTAYQLFKRAADAGDGDAQNNLGTIYFNGQLGEPDIEKALEMFTRSAKQSNQKAQLTLGIMYLEGMGVEQNNSEAQYWLAKSAEQGDESAQMHLGRLYSHSYGEHRNLEEGIWWLQRSMEQGNPCAKELIECAENELENERNRAEYLTPGPMVGDNDGKKWISIRIDEYLWKSVYIVTLGGILCMHKSVEFDSVGPIPYDDIVNWGFLEISESRGVEPAFGTGNACIEGDLVDVTWTTQHQPDGVWMVNSSLTWGIVRPEGRTAYVGSMRDCYHGNDESKVIEVQDAKLRIIESSNLDESDKFSYSELVSSDPNIALDI